MVWFSLVWTPGYGSTTRSTNALAPVTISLTGHFKFSQSAAMAGQLIHYYHQYHGSAKNVYDIIFSSLQMMGRKILYWLARRTLKYSMNHPVFTQFTSSLCIDVYDGHHQKTSSTALFQKWGHALNSGKVVRLVRPMWFPNAADFQNWGYTLNSGNLASQAPPCEK